MTNTANDQMVGVQGKDITVLAPKQIMSKEEAVRHACWLLVLSGATRGEVAMQLAAIERC